jgi:hypothetical protein
MTVRRCNPGHMSAAARLSELGALLARGYRRMRQISQNGVDDMAATERPCDRAAGEARARHRSEVA